MRPLLLWMLGIPIPIIILLYVFDVLCGKSGRADQAM
jgi:hypothetical protein